MDSVLGSEEKWKNVLWCRAFGYTLEKGLAKFGIKSGKLLSAPAFSKKTDESTPGSTFEVRILDVFL